jgi:hypothetical protein
LNIHSHKLKGKESAQAQCKPASLAHSTLLPLPEIPSALPDNGSPDTFGNFHRLGLAFLDENGDHLEFSAGVVLDDDKGRRTQIQEPEVTMSEYLDSEESDATSAQFEWTAQGGKLEDYWPYPSKTVSGGFRVPNVS